MTDTKDDRSTVYMEKRSYNADGLVVEATIISLTGKEKTEELLHLVKAEMRP